MVWSWANSVSTYMVQVVGISNECGETRGNSDRRSRSRHQLLVIEVYTFSHVFAAEDLTLSCYEPLLWFSESIYDFNLLVVAFLFVVLSPNLFDAKSTLHKQAPIILSLLFLIPAKSLIEPPPPKKQYKKTKTKEPWCSKYFSSLLIYNNDHFNLILFVKKCPKYCFSLSLPILSIMITVHETAQLTFASLATYKDKYMHSFNSAYVEAAETSSQKAENRFINWIAAEAPARAEPEAFVVQKIRERHRQTLTVFRLPTSSQSLVLSPPPNFLLSEKSQQPNTK